MKIFGFIGEKQCGKSSLCSLIIQKLPHLKVVEKSFAKNLKDLCVEKFNIPKQCCFGTDNEKNQVIGTWGRFFGPDILNKYNKRDDANLSGRELMQILGTDIMRTGLVNQMASIDFRSVLDNWLLSKFGDDYIYDKINYSNIWIDLLIKDIKNNKESNDLYLISDVRFINEVNALKSIGSKMVRLYRNTGCSNSIKHPSEMEMAEMDETLFNYILRHEDNKNMSQLDVFANKILFAESLVGVP